MSRINIIKNDEDVGELSGASIAMLESVVNRYKLENTVYLFESSHGYIVIIRRSTVTNISRFGGGAVRMVAEDASFFSALSGMRWFEFNADKISLGFSNKPRIDVIGMTGVTLFESASIAT